MKKVKRIFVKIFIFFVKLWGSIWYDKKYFYGRYFLKDHYSIGWKLIMKCWFPQKVLGYGRDIPFPIHRECHIAGVDNLVFDSNDITNFQSPGTYYQSLSAKLYIGKGTYIGPNVGLITTNHDIEDLNKHVNGKDVVIGDNCWIGMNSVILPGVKLGNHTIVGAGSIVTKSFEDGNCVIAGNPAKIIRRL